eukprot:9844109-Ditylum_brightwellii.AAC.1
MYDTINHHQPQLYEGWFDPMPYNNKTPLTTSDLNVVYEASSEGAYTKLYKDKKEEYKIKKRN